jgi:type II secretory pathway component GspD/PulD (secretin)
MLSKIYLFKFCFLVVFFLINSTYVFSAPIPWSQKPVQLSVREQSIKGFLEEIGAAQGIPVLVSEAVQGNVSGQFSGNAQQVFERIIKLTHYYHILMALHCTFLQHQKHSQKLLLLAQV